MFTASITQFDWSWLICLTEQQRSDLLIERNNNKHAGVFITVRSSAHGNLGCANRIRCQLI